MIQTPDQREPSFSQNNEAANVQSLIDSGLRFRHSQTYPQFEEKANLYAKLNLDQSLLPSELMPDEESFYDKWKQEQKH